MLLVIDNYDSFTYNLVQYFGELGAELAVKRNDEITLDEIRAMKPERIVISPGPCTPNEAGISCDVIRTFGLPLTVPAGKVARITSYAVRSARRRPSTLLTMCMTWL